MSHDTILASNLGYSIFIILSINQQNKFKVLDFLYHCSVDNWNRSLQLIMPLMFLEQGIGTDQHCLIEIMFTRTPAKIKEIRDIYESGKY